MPVRILPGFSRSTLMPRGFNSSRRPAAKNDAYALVAEYTVRFGFGANADTDDTWMTNEPRRMYGRHRRISIVDPMALRRIIRSNASGSDSSTNPALATPALATTTPMSGLRASNSFSSPA